MSTLGAAFYFLFLLLSHHDKKSAMLVFIYLSHTVLKSIANMKLHGLRKTPADVCTLLFLKDCIIYVQFTFLWDVHGSFM